MSTMNDREKTVLASFSGAPSWDQLHVRVEEHLGKRVQIKDLPSGSVGAGVTGMWMDTEKKSIIFLAVDRSEALRKHSLLHEYAHILLGHEGCDLQAGDLFQSIGKNWSVGRLLRRSGAATPQEVSAEHLACEIAKRMRDDVSAGMKPWV